MSKTKKNFWDDFRFEFNLYINDNIICQRKFNVKNYNKQVLRSLELNEMMRSITGMNNDGLGQCGILPTYFKNKCQSVSWRYYNPWRDKEFTNEPKNLFDNEDIFTFEVKVDKKSVAKSQFSGNWFQVDVRYDIDIREIIPEIISELDYYMSRSEYTPAYRIGA